MKFTYRIALTLALVSILAVSAQAQDALVQIIHNSPDPAAATVDIYVNAGPAPAIEDLGFREATGLVTLPAGVDLDVGIAPGNSTGPGDIIATFTYNLPADSRTVIMAAGLLSGSPSFDLYTNELQETAAGGEVGLLAFHGSPDAPTVDVIAVGVGTLFDDLEYATFQGYLAVPEGDYTLWITPGDDPLNPVVAYAVSLTGLGGGTAVVFASGYLSGSPAFGLFAALVDGTVVEFPTTAIETASVQIIHNSPDPAATTVDIYLNAGSAPAIEDLAFREATGLVTLPAGIELAVGIAPGNSTGPSDIIASFLYNLPPDSKTVIMAAGLIGDEPAFDLYTNELQDTAAGGEVGLLAFHGSPDAPTVDVVAVGVGTLFDDLQYGTFQGYLPVPEGDYTLWITPFDDPTNPVVAYSVPLTGLGGGTAVVFASGYLAERQPFGLLAALVDGTVVEFTTTVNLERSTWGSLKNSYR